MTSAPSLEDLFTVISAATFGQFDVRVPLPENPQIDDLTTRLGIALNVLLDDLAQGAAKQQHEFAERERLASRLQILADASREFSAATADLGDLLDVVARRLGELVGDMCSIRPLTEDGQWLEERGAVYHRDPELLGATRELMSLGRQRVGEGISGRVAASGEALLVPKISTADFAASTESKYRPFIERLGVASAITLPLLCRGRSSASPTSSAAAPTARTRRTTSRFVQSRRRTTPRLAIANARSYAAERASHAAAVSANEALHESEEAHRLLFEASPLAALRVRRRDARSARRERGGARPLRLQRTTSSCASEGLGPRRRGTATRPGQGWRPGGTPRPPARRAIAARTAREFVAEYTTRALTFAGRRARIAVIKDITDRYEAERTRALLAAIVQSSQRRDRQQAARRNDHELERGRRASLRLRGRGGRRPADHDRHPSRSPRRGARAARANRRGRADRSLRDGSPAQGRNVGRRCRSRSRRSGTPTGNVVGVSKTARDLTAQRDGRASAPTRRGAAAPVAEDGGGRAARGRRRSRLQQRAVGHPQLLGNAARRTSSRASPCATT